MDTGLVILLVWAEGFKIRMGIGIVPSWAIFHRARMLSIGT